MNTRVDGDPQIDTKFNQFLDQAHEYATDYRLLDNMSHNLLKRALGTIHNLIGRIHQANAVNHEQQTGAVKGELRKFKNQKKSTKP